MGLKSSILVLATLLSLCWTNASIVLEPSERLVFLGECPTFYCKISTMQYGNSSSLYFSFRGKNFTGDHFEIVDEKTMKFSWCINDYHADSMLFCKQNMTAGIFAESYIRIEKPLVPIPKDSIGCLISERILICSWTLGEAYIWKDEINVSLTAAAAITGEISKCPNASQLSCRWRDYVIPPHQINLTVFHEDRLDNKLVTIYKLPIRIPVKYAQVGIKGPGSLQTNSSCFKIKWEHRSYYKLLFNVTLYSELDGKHECNVSRKRQLEVCHLLPGEEYQVTISSFPINGPGNWSDPLVLTDSTKSTHPSQPPTLTNSSFKWTANKSAVILYWKCLTRRQSGAKKVWYLIEDETQLTKASSGLTTIKLPPHTPDDKCWLLQIWAENAFGRSKTSSSITICDNTSDLAPPDYVEWLIVNSTHLKVMWTKPAIAVESETTFQIVGYKNCSTDVKQWEVVGNESAMVLQMDDDEGYSFGVATQNAQGSSSGLTWGFCHYLMKFPQKPLAVTLVEPFDDIKLQIDWEPYDCRVEKAFVIEYNIKYCKSLDNSSCHEKEKVTSVSRSERKFRTSQLPPNKYLVWIEPVTYGGSGPSSVKRMVQIPDLSWTIGAIAGITIAVAFVLMLVFFGCKHLKMKYSSEMAKCNPQIDASMFPVHSDFSRTNNDSSYFDISPTSENTAITEISSLGSSHKYVHVNPVSSGSQENNNNAPSQEVSEGDFAASSQESADNNSTPSNGSVRSHDKLLFDSGLKKDAELRNEAGRKEENPGYFSAVYAQQCFANKNDFSTPQNKMAANMNDFCTKSKMADNVQSGLSRPEPMKIRPANNSSKQKLLIQKLDKVTPTNKTNHSFVPENGDLSMKKEIVPQFSGEDQGYVESNMADYLSTDLCEAESMNPKPANTSSKEKLVTHKSNKDSSTNKTNHSFVPGNGETSKNKDMPSQFSGEDQGYVESNMADYVSSDFCEAQSLNLKPANSSSKEMLLINKSNKDSPTSKTNHSFVPENGEPSTKKEIVPQFSGEDLGYVESNMADYVSTDLCEAELLNLKPANASSKQKMLIQKSNIDSPNHSFVSENGDTLTKRDMLSHLPGEECVPKAEVKQIDSGNISDDYIVVPV